MPSSGGYPAADVPLRRCLRFVHRGSIVLAVHAPHAPRGSRLRLPPMKFDSKFWQRAFLAFTTGLFLSCAARMSETGPSLPSTPSGFSLQP